MTRVCGLRAPKDLGAVRASSSQSLGVSTRMTGPSYAGRQALSRSPPDKKDLGLLTSACASHVLGRLHSKLGQLSRLSSRRRLEEAISHDRGIQS